MKLVSRYLNHIDYRYKTKQFFSLHSSPTLSSDTPYDPHRPGTMARWDLQFSFSFNYSPQFTPYLKIEQRNFEHYKTDLFL